MTKFLSGRSKRRDQGSLTTDRYLYLGIDQTEPNLGDPNSGTFQDNPPAGERYQIISVEGFPGERYWIPVEGGVIPGSISVYDETTTLVGNANSITQLNFVGAAVNASTFNFKETTITLLGSGTPSGTHSFALGIAVTQKSGDGYAEGIVKFETSNVGFVTLTNVRGTFNTTVENELFEGTFPGTGIAKTPTTLVPVTTVGIAATIKVSPEEFSDNKQVIFNDNEEFGSGNLYFDKDTNRLGVGIANPTKALDVSGDIKLTDDIYIPGIFYLGASANDSGSQGAIIKQGAGGTMEWVTLESIISGAGGTIGNVQFHGTTQLVDGDNLFNFNPYLERVGVNTTFPAQVFQVGVGYEYKEQKLVLHSNFPFNITPGMKFEQPDSSGAVAYATSARTTSDNVTLVRFYPKIIEGRALENYPNFVTGLTSQNRLKINGSNTTRTVSSTTVTTGLYDGSTSVTTIDADGRVGIGTLKTTSKQDGTIAKLQIDGDVLFTGDSYDALWDTSASALRLYDDTKLTLGNNSDLQIYHSGSNSYIDNYINHLYIRNNVDNDDGGDIYIEAKKGESSIDCISDGSVRLYHKDSRKLETDADGVAIYDGNTNFGDLKARNLQTLYTNQEAGYLKISNWQLVPGASIKDGFYLYSVYDDQYSNGYISLNSDSNSLPLTIGVVDYHQGLSATGIHTAIKVNQFNEVGVSTNGTSVELWFENGGTNNTLDRQGFHGSKKLETTEEGITVYNKTTTSELSATVKTETADLKATGISTFKNITLGFADANTVGTTLGGLTIDSQGTVTVEDSVVINSTENTTGNADGALIVDGGVHIKKDMLLCNDLDTLDTIDPVKVGIGTLSPQSRFQIGTKSEYFTDLTATGNLSFTPGTPGVGTDGITGIDTTGIEVGQEIKNEYFYTGTKVNLIGGLVPPSGTGIGTIYVDTVSTNTSILNSQSFGFGSRGGTREEKSIFTVTDQGKVGVGTLTPRFALDVVDTLGVGHTLGVAQTAYVYEIFASDDIEASDAVIGDRLFARSGVYILEDSPLRFGDSVNGNTLIYWDDGSDYNIWSNWDYRPIPAFSDLYSKGWRFNTIMYLANFGFAYQYSNFIITNDGNVSIGNSTSPASADDLEANTNNSTVLNCGIVTANQYYGSLFWGSHKGDGSQLTGVIGVGTGVELKRDGETVGAASTIDIGYGLKLTYSAESGALAGVATLRIDPNADIDGDRSIFSSYSDYASHSETSNGSYNLVGIGSTYIEVGAIELDNPNSNDEFGHTVATSADGKTIIVGAPDHDTNLLSNVGAVYVFDREGNTYSQVGFFTGSYATSGNEYFGQKIACSADGKTIVVGNQLSELPGSGTNSGLVYVFDRAGNDFNEVGILTGTYASHDSDNFGSSVATSADGKTIAVGAVYDENVVNGVDAQGLVYVFDRVGNDFNQVGILSVSSGAALFDDFGYSVACSADGKTIAVGAIGDESGATVDNVGAIYVFDRVGNDFNQVGILTASYDTVRYDFGREVKISADGKTIIGSAYYLSGSGDPTKGTVHVFDRVGNDFNEVGILTAGTEYADDNDYFGWSVATSADGKTIFVGASNDEYSSTFTTGIVHVFNRQGNNFNKVGIITGSYATDTADKFGYALACSADGKSVIASALNDEIGGTDAAGVVYVFDQTTVARDAITATDTGVLITGDLNVTGDITAFYTSDERLKDNITPIDDPLEKVISISGNTFDWNQNSNKSGHDVGVIAQEIKEILPEAVTERDNGYLAVDYYKVIPLLIEAIKEISEDKNIITSKNGVKYRLVVDDDGNLSTENV